MQIPCLFDINPETREATGTVAPFCSVSCRSKASGTLGFPVSKEGLSYLSDFGYTPHCEECNAEIVDELKGTEGRHTWALGADCEDGIPAFVDDRQLAYRPTPEAARAYAREVIERIQRDGDYLLSDKPAGFMPPASGALS